MKSKSPHHRFASLAVPLPTQARGGMIALLLLLAMPVQAATPNDEARAQGLFAEVRCVVCQSESIADSDAEIAADMRRDIRAQIAAGTSDADIRKHLYARYGDYVLFRPRVSKANMALWALPPLIVLLGAGGLFMMVKKRRDSDAYELSGDEQKKLRELLNKPD